MNVSTLLIRASSALREHGRSTAVRGMSAVCALAINVAVVAGLSLADVGYYYLFATVAYFGNAAVFVGIGLQLQRKSSSLASTGHLNKSATLAYIGRGWLCGVAIVAVSGGSYFAATLPDAWWSTALSCAVLSGASYLSATGRDLLTLYRKQELAASANLLEQMLRLGLTLLALSAFPISPTGLILANAMGASMAGLCGIGYVLKSARGSQQKLGIRPAELYRIVSSVGCSSLLNWGQLQAYRPILILLGVAPETIGIASLLTTFGSTGSLPVFTTLSQKYIPKLYSGLDVLKPWLKALLMSAGALAVLVLPAVAAFLFATNRMSLLPYMILASMGVLVEGGNALIGALVHQRNHAGRSIWPIAGATSLGFLVIVFSWQITVPPHLIPYLIGSSLVASQVVTFSIAYLRQRPTQ